MAHDILNWAVPKQGHPHDDPDDVFGGKLAAPYSGGSSDFQGASDPIEVELSGEDIETGIRRDRRRKQGLPEFHLRHLLKIFGAYALAVPPTVLPADAAADGDGIDRFEP
jgi:hypothetical protein